MSKIQHTVYSIHTEFIVDSPQVVVYIILHNTLNKCYCKILVVIFSSIIPHSPRHTSQLRHSPTPQNSSILL